MKTKLLFALLAVTTLGSVHAFADDDLDINVCAAFYPCNADGSVIAEFDEGDCAEVYRSQCNEISAQSLGGSPSMALRYSQCRASKKELRGAAVKRERKIAELRAKIRELEQLLSK